jgi:hypothetical protein
MKQHCEIRLPAAPQDPGTENYSTPKHARTHSPVHMYVSTASRVPISMSASNSGEREAGGAWLVLM